MARHVQAILTALLVVFVSSAEARRAAPNAQETSQRQLSYQGSGLSQHHPPSQPQCQTRSAEQMVISCSYRSAPAPASKDRGLSRIALTHAVFSFSPEDSSIMRVELTFTNTGRLRTADARTVYLEIDTSGGSNHTRRSLPTVDFRRLSPGKAVTFSEHLRVAAFPPGRYTIALWIPSSEPAMEFNPARNFLISSAGVPDPRTGLNILANFTVGGGIH